MLSRVASSSSLWLLALMTLPAGRVASSAELSVVNFTLIDADTDQPIPGFDPLPSNAALNLAFLPTKNLNVRANTSPSAVGSVRFGLNGNPTFRTESAAPYALAGDNGGDYLAWTPPLGANNLTATPYSGARGAGSPGVSLSIVFTVIDDPTGNVPPVADAGLDLVVGLPPGAVTLTGSGQDPDGTITSYRWTQVSGLSAVLGDTGSPDLAVTNLIEGQYVFRLTVTDDGGASGSDEAQVVVYASSGAGGIVSGDLKKWHRVEIAFRGPSSTESSNSPNPFLDYRLNATLQSPSGRSFTVPGFFAGDGKGGGRGDVWKVRFNPDEAGDWTYIAHFRTGPDVAVDTSPLGGTATAFDGSTGSFTIAETDQAAPGFLKWGLLEWVGGHYLKFRDGSYWLKGGADSPENFLGYKGFDNTPNYTHSYPNHIVDWRSTDPDFVSNTTGYDAKAIIGAINYLADHHVNSIYFLPMNIGGDGQDTWPFVGPVDQRGSSTNDDLHYDISKLEQWEIVFEHMQKKGILLHFVLNEAEELNKKELDGGTLGKERKLFYRELIARFAHHNALQWNISEEYDYLYDLTSNRVKQFAAYIQNLDPYKHPITVHQQGNPETQWTPFLGDSRFSLTSFQFFGSIAGRGAEVEKWRNLSQNAGRAIPISMDELRSTTQSNMAAQRKDILWPTYLSGGQIELYMGGEDQSLEDFTRYQEIWDWMWYARRFLEDNFPFWNMEPHDRIVSGVSNPQCLALPGSYYAIYLPFGGNPTIDLTAASASESFQMTWYDPTTGNYLPGGSVMGGALRDLGPPPFSDDSAIALIKSQSPPPPPISNQVPVVDAGPDQEVTLPTNTLALIGSATDDGLPDPPSTLTYAWTVVSGPGSVSFSNGNAFSTSASFSTAGTYTLRLSVSDSVLSAADDVALIVHPQPAPTDIVYRINAGGPAFTDFFGANWSADEGFFNTGNAFSRASSIAGTELDTLYQSERWDPSSAPEMIYSFPVDAGLYVVRLHFAEIYSGAASNGGRVFDVLVEGQLALNGYDIYAKAGFQTAAVEELEISVTDGSLDIEFQHVVENPKISGIEVLKRVVPVKLDVSPVQLDFGGVLLAASSAPQRVTLNSNGTEALEVFAVNIAGAQASAFSTDAAAVYTIAPGASVGFDVTFTPAVAGPSAAILEVFSNDPDSPRLLALRGDGVPAPPTLTTPFRVNAGGGDYTDLDGNLWFADTDFVNTGNKYSTSAAIAATALDTLYQSERWDSSSAPEMRYTFPLDPGVYLVRLHFAEIYSGSASAGGRVFDVLVEGELALDDYDIFSTVGFRAARIEEVSIAVNDGALDIQFLHVVENPKISAIEILRLP